MLGATGKASERERVRKTRAVTNAGEDTEKEVCRVEKSSIIITDAQRLSGYNRIRVGDGARSLPRSQVQGDVGAQKVDPQVGSTQASDTSKGEAPSSMICSPFPYVSSPLNGIPKTVKGCSFYSTRSSRYKYSRPCHFSRPRFSPPSIILLVTLPIHAMPLMH